MKITQSVEQWIYDYDKTEDKTMDLDELVPSTSKYLAKEDVGIAGMNLTIAKFTRETVGSGKDQEECAILHFTENMKPMVLNKTNKNRIKHYLDAKTAEEVIGKVINAYNDPDVEYGGEITGGLRLRGAQSVGASDPLDDDPSDPIPF